MQDKRIVFTVIVALMALAYWGHLRREKAHDIAVRLAVEKQNDAIGASMSKAREAQKAYQEKVERKLAEMQWKIRNETLQNMKIEAEKKLRREKMSVEETNAEIYGEPVEKKTELVLKPEEPAAALEAASPTPSGSPSAVPAAGPAPASVLDTSPAETSSSDPK